MQARRFDSLRKKDDAVIPHSLEEHDEEQSAEASKHIAPSNKFLSKIMGMETSVTRDYESPGLKARKLGSRPKPYVLP